MSTSPSRAPVAAATPKFDIMRYYLAAAATPTVEQVRDLHLAILLARQHGVTLPEGVCEVRWWRPGAHEPAGVTLYGRKPIPIFLSIYLHGRELARTVAHELRHAAQELRGTDLAQREADAYAFADRVMAGWRW